MSNLTNSKEFKDSFKEIYRKFEVANEKVTDYYRDETYQFMWNRLQKGYTANPYSQYFRTYALRETMEAPMSTSPIGHHFTIGWNENRTNFESSSIWGSKTVKGTHRTFFGSSKYGLSVGDEVPVPLILNDMRNHNLSRKRPNKFYGFIDETESFISSNLIRNHKRHFTDFFDI